MARKSAISFGLVHIPIKYENAIQDNSISFNQLHKDTKERIRYKKSTETINEVKSDDIVKGYEYEKDKYVIMLDEDFEKIKTEKDRSINIISFTDIAKIDPIFYEKSYYLTPDGSDKAFALFTKAIDDERKGAIAKTVLGTNETLVLLRTLDGALIMETMFYLDELKPKPQPLINVVVNDSELAMAKSLISSMTTDFSPQNYHDEYQVRLKEAIMQKINGDEIISAQTVEDNNVINLMEALQASLLQLNDGNINQPKKRGRPKKDLTKV